MKIYVASSWRNEFQETVVSTLRAASFEVYDFKHPSIGDNGFHWSEIDKNWIDWDARRFRKALNHSIANSGFKSDFEAMQWADTFVLVLPCGRSAHLELGWACGAGKKTIILLAHKQEPELMYKCAQHICVNLKEVLDVLKEC